MVWKFCIVSVRFSLLNNIRKANNREKMPIDIMVMDQMAADLISVRVRRKSVN